jgi:hypothetical protein
VKRVGDFVNDGINGCEIVRFFLFGMHLYKRC